MDHVLSVHARSVVFFTALHGMQTRTSDEKAVRLSVERVDRDKMQESSAQIFIPYERLFSLVF